MTPNIDVFPFLQYKTFHLIKSFHLGNFYTPTPPTQTSHQPAVFLFKGYMQLVSTRESAIIVDTSILSYCILILQISSKALTLPV